MPGHGSPTRAGVSSDEGMTMRDHRRRLGPVLAMAAALALLLTTLPVAAATAGSMKDCQVANLTAHTTHRSLQHAVWKARSGRAGGPGQVQRHRRHRQEPAHQWRDRGRHLGRPHGIRQREQRPADHPEREPAASHDRDHPRVSELTIDAGIIIRGGLAIGAPAKWLRTNVPQTRRPPMWKVKPRIQPACRTDRVGQDLVDGVARAAPGDESGSLAPAGERSTSTAS